MKGTATASAGMPAGAASLTDARRRAPWNAAANAAGFLINLGLSVYITPLLVHGLGSVGFGIWALIGHVAGNLGLLDFGMGVTATRYFARQHALGDRERMRQVLSSALLFSALPLGLALATGLAVAWMAPALFHLPAGYVFAGRVSILLVALSVGLMFPGGVLNCCLPALSRYDLLNVRGIFWGAARAAGLWWVLRRGHGLIAVGLVCLASEAAALALGVLLAHRLVPWLRVGWSSCSRSTLRQLTHFSFWAFLLSIASRLIFTADNLVVGIALGPVAVAFYGVGSSIADQVRSGMATLTNLFAPMAAQVHALRGREEMAQLLVDGTRLAVLLTLPGVVSLIVLGHPFLAFWLGPEYAARSSGILALLCATTVLYALSVTCTQVLYGMGRHRVNALLALGEAVTNLCLSVALARRLGAIGVAWGTLLPALVTEGLLIPLFTCRELGLGWPKYAWQALGRPWIAATPLLMWLVWLRIGDLVRGWLSLSLWLLPGLCLYAASAWMAALTTRERRWAKSLLSSWLARRRVQRLGRARDPLA